jgi:hypothetical protein
MTEVLDSLPFDDIIVWNNSERQDFGIYGRYAAIEYARNDVIVTQDDDLVVRDWQAVIDRYRPGELFCNYTEPWDIPWVARGAIFDRDLPRRAFDKYLGSFEFDRAFTHYICDAVFGLLTEKVTVEDVGGSYDLPHAFQGARISLSPGWYDGYRPEAQKRCAALA